LLRGGAPGRGFYGKIRDVTISSQLESMDALTAEVIYEDNFDGSSSVSLTGQSPDQCPDGEVWFGSSNGNVWMADGSIPFSSVNQHRNVFLPFSPSTGKVYRLTLIIDRFDTAEDWVGVGFCEEPLVDVGFGNSTLSAEPWVLHSGDLSAVSQTFVGPGTTGGMTFDSVAFPVEMKILLDTRENGWSVEWFYNDQSIRSYSYAIPPDIEYVGFGRFGNTGIAVSSFKLTSSP